MTVDGRHPRTRWAIAAAGWLLCIVSLTLPGAGEGHLWEVYPVITGAILQHGVGPHSAVQIAIVLNLAVGTCAMAISPMLMLLNHSLRPSLRRWRWLALGLPPVTVISIQIIITGESPYMTSHLLFLSHLIVCAAILPWPRETVPTGRGFEVIACDCVQQHR